MKYFLFFLFSLSLHAASAQVDGYSFHHEQGQYTSITDPIYAGATISEHRLQDNYASPAKVALPFPFRFAGKVVDSIGIHANGYIWFGRAGWGDMTNKWPISAQQPSSVRGVVSAFGMDLHPVAGSKLRSGWTGTAPMRMFVVEWEGVSREETWTAQPDAITFQIRLYESSGRIEINYGPCLLTGAASTAIEVGIKGADYNDYHSRILTGNWAVSSKGTSQIERSMLNTANKPGPGQLLVWEAWQQPTGVSPIAAAENILHLYPQPAGEFLHLNLPEDGAGFHWKISDMSGRTLLSGRNAGGDNGIGIASLASGAYVLMIQTGHRQMQARFVKS